MRNRRSKLIWLAVFTLIYSAYSFAQMDEDDVDNLVLKETSPQIVRLSWTAAKAAPCVDAVTYSVFRDNDENFEPSPKTLLASKISSTHYISHEPTQTKTYYYHVRAVRSAAHCAPNNADNNGGNISRDNGNRTTDALIGQILTLEKQVTDLENKLTYYKYLIDRKQDTSSSIQLDPSNHDFQRLDSDTGSFLVSVKDASAYLNGYRLKLSIGNPSAATFSRVTVKVRWARAYDWNKFSDESYKQWQNSVHEKEVTLTSDLSPGAWNTVDLDLVPAAADELGFLEVSLKSPSVILYIK